MNIKTSTLLTLAIAAIFAISSCSKIKEATQRDISISPEGVDFIIPIVNTTTEGSAMGTVGPIAMNLDAMIKEKASQFGVSNIKNIRITGIKIVLKDADEKSHVGNLEKITAKVKANGQEEVIVASANQPNSEAVVNELIIPITNGGVELKNYLTSSSLTYQLTGKARRVTEKPLNARANFTYTFTVGL